jgi:isoamylase
MPTPAPRPSPRRKISAGKHYPLGASLATDGVNFAIYSKHAKGVVLELFDRPDGPPTDRIEIEHCTRHVWHVFVQGLRAGTLYGYRVRGDYNPQQGHRFNPAKLLVDPYAKAFSHKFANRDNLLLGYDPGSEARDLSRDDRDDAAGVPKCIVVDDQFDWQGDTRPDLPLESLLIYEVHVKGFTAHASSKVREPGTYLGFADKIPYLKELGVNAVELLPIHEFHIDDFLRERSLSNYWGYNSYGFFAPESSYGTRREPGCEVREFKTLVRELHKAGIEVILDVVYNHTAEGNELGATLCFKGIDNPTYYVLTGPPFEPARYYTNHTGCGNSLNLADPAVIRLVMDSLRYWVEVMHVDGFRFDLASVLGREGNGFYHCASFFDAISQDPVLATVKLIAEPWDLGTYQVGNFPVDWSEWNGRFRDTLRKFGKGDPGQMREIGWRLSGSADLYADDGRSAYNSINFITCHDGFTLYDLCSYNHKHNDANLENNRDGADDNNSWNCGVEGATDDPEVLRLRRQLCKNHICHLLFALGTPMLLGGDEFLRTQQGNNNAYCQDNELSWYDWREVERNRDFLEFVRKAIAFAKRHPILHRRKFYSSDLGTNDVPDIAWSGTDAHPSLWDDAEVRTVCYQLDGGEEASELGDYRLFFILNPDWRMQCARPPELGSGKRWYRVIDTSLPAGQDFCAAGKELLLEPGDHYLANPRSTVVLIGR